MTRLPHRLLARELRYRGLDAPPEDRFGVVMAFLDPGEEDSAREVLERSLRGEDVEVMTWRRVPVNPRVLGDRARASMPIIEQGIVVAGASIPDADGFERRLLLARKAAHRIAGRGDEVGFHVASASCRVVVYKGLFTADQIESFYWDLLDPEYETDFGVFHQRYSTNTEPSWSLAQPFRMLAHNGEINTIRSNRAWMAAREEDADAEVWEGRTVDLRPFLGAGRSDSASLDNAFELLVRSGRSLVHAKEMLIPAAWENVADLDAGLRAFYEYHAFLTEPWDGPVALAASDGVTVLAGVDRNGLRPARWTITPDVVVVASEAGVARAEEIQAVATGQLGPGETIAVDLETGEVAFDADLKAGLASRRPYGEWIETGTAYVRDPFDALQDDRFDPERLARVFGYTAEERRMLLAVVAEGRPAVGSMGDDTPLAVLAEHPQRLSRYFRQMFAQVTNPPMDPIRERLMMSLRTYVGRRGSLLTETEVQAHLMELASPILADAEIERMAGNDDPAFRSVWLEAVLDAASGPAGLQPALEGLCRDAEQAVRDGATILVLSDREVDARRAPIPMLLAVGAVHHALISAGLRMRASIVAVSGEPRDEHDLACLLAYGASAVNPYLAIEQVRALAAAGAVAVGPIEAQENYRAQMESGLLKVLSKMGICTISAYRGSELFEVVGLDDEITDVAFRNTSKRVGGRGFLDIARHVLELHSRYDHGAEDAGGYYKARRGGVPHVTSPKAVLALQRAARRGDGPSWERYLDEVQRERPLAHLRDLVAFVDRSPVPVEQVETAEQIMTRFVTSAMSMGALSAEAHEALAEAMARIGAMSNSGEGGEDPARFGTPRNSAIKQVASGRFGVTPAYLASARELQIKMAQGSKPGEGGQLPGHKVSEEIARLRHTEPGVPLISPPPHHDIYSIEDLAQLIFDLKTFSPTARVSVKLVSEPGVGVIAVGVAKAQADAVLVSGADGGTGASPLTSIKHAGSPWELGVAEAHQALAAAGIREGVVLEVDGGLRTGRDVVIAALLGAERFGFGTLPLLALGCKMVRQCHENTCPVGIATQREDLRAKFTGAADQVVTVFRLLAEDVRSHMAALGIREFDDLIGRTDLLRPVDRRNRVAAALSELLVPVRTTHSGGYRRVARSPLGEALATDAAPAVASGTAVRIAYPIQNTDRAVGTRLSGAIAAAHPEGLPDCTIRVRLSGTAGQSLGAFLARGVEIRLDGTANDYVGKGMGGGTIVIVPQSPDPAHGAGNAVLYGATGGRLFVCGSVGQRFAVRNSGAAAVVEGCGDHGAEYMTGGVAVVLGPVGRNTAAGMTGGVLFVHDPEGNAASSFAETAPPATRPRADDLVQLRAMVEAHAAATGSGVAATVLRRWDDAAAEFWVLRATDAALTGPVAAAAGTFSPGTVL